MNRLELWTQTPLAKAVAATLLHSLWEGAAIAVVLAAALCALRSPRTRYGAACIALAAMLAAFLATLAQLWPAAAGAVPGHAILPPPPQADSGPLETIARAFRPADLLPWLAPLWIVGVIAFQLRAIAGWIGARRLRRSGVCCAPAEWTARLRGIAARIRVSRAVVLLESSLAEAPVVIGYLRPVILMPAGLLTGLPPEQIEAILAHELAHIARRDYLVNLIQTVVEGLLFYHPAVWWIGRTIRAEREHCCDDAAVAICGNARGYAAALAALEEYRNLAGELALAATGGNLMHRIRRILKAGEKPRVAFAPVTSAAVLLLALAAALAAWQAVPAPPPLAVAAPGPPLAQEPLAAAAVPAPAATPHPAQLQSQPGSWASAAAVYHRWLNEDVAYIITDSERAAFKALPTDAQREAFIEQFWLKRDPTPGTPTNEFKEEHYRRIAYANEHFASYVPGWKTDRGRVYIIYGPPDEIEDHSSGGLYQRPPQEGSGQATTVPFQQWRYRYIEGVGENVIIEFIDPARNGEYRMTTDPAQKYASDALVKPLNSFISTGGDPQVTVNVMPGGAVRAIVESDSIQGDWQFAGAVLSGTQTKANVRDHLSVGAARAVGRLHYDCTFHLDAGSYTLQMTVKDPTGAVRTRTVEFYVN